MSWKTIYIASNHPLSFPIPLFGISSLATLLSWDWSRSRLFICYFVGLTFPFLCNNIQVTINKYLFGIQCNILSLSILVFQEQVFFQNGYVRKWDIKKMSIEKKMKEKVLVFKECDLPQNDIIWNKMRMRLDEVKMLLHVQWVYSTYFESQLSLRKTRRL